MSNIEIKEVGCIKELSSIQIQLWKSYLEKSNDARTVFQQPELLVELDQVSPNIDKVLNYVIYKNGVISGILSFKKQMVKRFLKFGHLRLFSCDFDEIRSFGCGTLLDCSIDECNEVRATISSNLHVEISKNNGYVLFEALEEKDIFFTPEGSSDQNEFKDYLLDPSDTFYMYFESDFSSFLLARSKSKRNSIKKDLRRFEREYEGRFSIKLGPINLSNEDFLNKAHSILNNSWKKGVIGSIVASPNFNDQLEILAENDLVRTFVLEVDNKPIAFAIGYYSGGNFFYEEIAYDERYAKSGVGSYLTISVVKLLHEINPIGEGAHKPVFSFGVGDNIYKRKLYSFKLKSMNLNLCKPYSKASLFFKSKFILDYLYKLIQKTIIKLGVHTWLRQKFKQR